MLQHSARARICSRVITLFRPNAKAVLCLLTVPTSGGISCREEGMEGLIIACKDVNDIELFKSAFSAKNVNSAKTHEIINESLDKLQIRTRFSSIQQPT